MYETRDAIFDESILVGSLQRLRDSSALSLRQMKKDVCSRPGEELTLEDGVSSGKSATLDSLKSDPCVG